MTENSSSSSSSKDWVEVLVAIGRIEEGIKGLRDSIDRLDKKSDNQADDISEMQMEIQRLKTSKNTTKENVALIASVLAITVASASVLGVLGLV
jgi:peptidoglycan hydrolase CwlO-like protein